MSCSLFHKPHLGLLQAVTFSLQLANSSEIQPIGRLENEPVNIGDIWVFDDFIIVDIPETDDAQIILRQPILTIASCHIDVRKRRIIFEIEGRYAVFYHMKEKVVSPNSSLLMIFPLPLKLTWRMS